LIAQNVDDVAVMYAGEVVEKASTKELFDNPSHPYTQGLINSIRAAKRKKRNHSRTASANLMMKFQDAGFIPM
jgi:ABC-type dipeptide/oligopeptide/nickel transport system ATPase component